ncbi:MAG: hypothetical protein J1F35_04755 [Erysipelotrichales bacterium]|nr:hypothetical protein [Erysipelotrichales bacterium]
MDEKEILETKYKFFECLIEYKELIEEYSKLVHNSSVKIKRCLERSYNAKDIANVRFKNIENMLHNKLVFLAKFFNQRNINMFYFQNPEDGQVYAVNFFGKHILGYYTSYFSHCFDLIADVTDLTEKLAKRIAIYPFCHSITALCSKINNGNVYSYDKKCLEIIAEIQQKYAEYIELEENLYKNTLDGEYLDMVKFYIILILGQSNNKKYTEDEIGVYYLIDCDFCRVFGREDLIEEITKIYKDCMEKMGYDPELIEDDKTPFFTKYVDPNFDPREFIYKSISELAAYKVRNDFAQIDALFKEMAASIPLAEEAIENLEFSNDSLMGEDNKEDNIGEEVGTEEQIKRIH